MGKLMDVDARLKSTEFCLSQKCHTCRKRQAVKYIPAKSVNVIPALLFAQASPLAVLMTKVSTPLVEGAEPEDVFVFFHCQDSPCLLAILHEMVSMNYIMDLKKDFEQQQIATSIRRNKYSKRKAQRERGKKRELGEK